MATIASAASGGSVSIGRVFERAFGAISHNPMTTLGIALVIGAIPGLLVTLFFSQFAVGLMADVSRGKWGGFVAATLISTAISLAIGALVQGALTRAVVLESEGRKASFGECLATGLRVLLPLVAVGIMWGVGVAVGTMLLIVPGVILALMWAVAAPALVVERPGVFGAFGRSRDLTRGSRWKIFGLFLIIVIAYWLLSVVIGFVGLATYQPTQATSISIGNMLASVVLGTLINAAWGTIQPSLYVELRQVKEGTGIDQLAEVFA